MILMIMNRRNSTKMISVLVAAFDLTIIPLGDVFFAAKTVV